MRTYLTAAPSLVLLLSLGGCDARPAAESNAPQEPGLTVTAQQFREFSWLAGRWKGTMPDGSAFFEAYRVADDSTLVSYSYPDSVTTTPADSGIIALRGGQVTTGSGPASYVVTELRSGWARFAPRGEARNSFTWKQESADAWTATLDWPASNDRPARHVVYPMRRLPTP
jgi:hypothetical protein